MFRGIIRVGLNWDRFFAERWPVERIVLDSHELLSRCFMPWYVGARGDEIAYDAAGAVPMSLADVPKAMPILHEDRQADILQYVEAFRTQTEPIAFSTPSYALPDGKYFVMDGNHRLSALTLNSLPFEVTLWNICGPLDSDCLLDLIHWQLEPPV